jgi:hypothetical protein
MEIALHWWEGQFHCEFKGDREGWVLSLFSGGELVLREPIRSATAASRRARELAASLSAPRRKKG